MQVGELETEQQSLQAEAGRIQVSSKGLWFGVPLRVPI